MNTATTTTIAIATTDATATAATSFALETDYATKSNRSAVEYLARLVHDNMRENDNNTQVGVGHTLPHIRIRTSACSK